jgi:hypothetical protein
MDWTVAEGSCCEHSNEPFGIHKMLGNFLVAPQVAACQEGLSSPWSWFIALFTRFCLWITSSAV